MFVIIKDLPCKVFLAGLPFVHSHTTASVTDDHQDVYPQTLVIPMPWRRFPQQENIKNNIYETCLNWGSTDPR